MLFQLQTFKFGLRCDLIKIKHEIATIRHQESLHYLAEVGKWKENEFQKNYKADPVNFHLNNILRHCSNEQIKVLSEELIKRIPKK